MLPLGKVIQNHDVLYQFYADDTQIYMPLKPTDPSRLANLVICLFQIKSWMSQNVLKFNDDKSEVILFCPSKSFSYFGVNLGCLSNNVRQAVRGLWVIFDASLCFDDAQSCFLQLKLISKIRSFLSTADLQQVKHAFIHSWLDCCNTLYSGIGHSSSTVSSWYRTLLLD